MKLQAHHIRYDVDLEPDENYQDVIQELNLPETMDIPAHITDPDEIADYISNTTEFCIFGFELQEIPETGDV